MSILITGSSGFAGSHLLEQLRGSAELVGWSRSGPPAFAAGARWRQIDLQDRDDVRDALRELKPSQVYHCAGVTHVSQSWGSPSDPLMVNVLGTHHLLDGLRRVGRPCRVLITGSATIYAPSSAPLVETSPLAPDSPYAMSKLAQELLATRAVEQDGLDVVITRSFNHTGPRQAPAFMASSIAWQIARFEQGLAEPVLRVGNLDPQRDLTDVRDVVRAYLALMTAGVSGEVYNVASGVAHPVRAVVEALVARARVPVRVEVDPALVRPVDNPLLLGDSGRLRAITGWTPQITFERMLDDLLDYWRAVITTRSRA